MHCVWDMDDHWKEVLVIVAAQNLEEVTSDVKAEPALQPLSSEEIQGNQSDKARSDNSASWFWSRGQIVFFNIKVFYPNTNVTKAKFCENVM